MPRLVGIAALAALPLLLAACASLIPDQAVADLYGFNGETFDLTVGPNTGGGGLLAPQASEIVAAGSVSIEVDPDIQLVNPNLALSISAQVPHGEIRLDAKVLVVDDRRDIRYLAQHFIERAGGEVVTLTNGKEAGEVMTSRTLSGARLLSGSVVAIPRLPKRTSPCGTNPTNSPSGDATGAPWTCSCCRR